MNSNPSALSAERIDAIREDLTSARETWKIGRGRFNAETNGEYIERVMAAVPELLAALASETARADAEVNRYPCDGGCSLWDGQEETCSAHGRPVAEVWDIAGKYRQERDEAREEVARLSDTTSPAWDEETVTEDVARAIWTHGAGKVTYLVEHLARMWDEGTLPQDPETQHSVYVTRAQTAAVLAVLRRRLPVRPDHGDLIAEAEALVDSWDRRGSWTADSPVGLVMRLAAALSAWPGESRAQVQAEAVQEVIGFLGSQKGDAEAVGYAHRAARTIQWWQDARLAHEAGTR